MKKLPTYAQDFINNMKQSFIGQGADPSSIIVKDLNNTVGTTNFLKLQNLNLPSLSVESKNIIAQLLSLYNKHIDSKRQLLIQSRDLYDTDIVQTVIDVIMDDAFNSFIDTKNEFRIEYKLDPDELEELGQQWEDSVQEEIDKVIDKFAIKERIADMIPELLRDGEYALGVTFEDNKGITDVVDDLDVIDLLPFYVGNKLSFIIKESQINPTEQGTAPIKAKPPVIYNPENIIYFRLKYFGKERIDIEPKMSLNGTQQTNFRTEFYKETGIYLPRFVRICRPIYYSAIKNINQLQIMMNVGTVQQLLQVVKPEIINVQVPATTSPIEAKKIVQDYEKDFNAISSNINLDNIDLSTMAGLATRRVVLPQWMDGKGATTFSDLNKTENTADTRDSITFLQGLIANSIGIPAFYLDGNQPIEKGQLTKIYSRYTRKLTSIQKSVGEGIIDFIMLHLNKKNIHVDRSNLSVTFKTLTSADSLDDTDVMVGTITALNDLYKALEEISSSPNNNLKLNSEKFKELFDIYANKYMAVTDLLEVEQNDFEEEDDDFGSESDGVDFTPDRDYGDSDFTNQSISEPSISEPSASTDTSYQDFATDTSNEPLTTEPQNIETEV